MTQEQVAKAKELSENIKLLSRCINLLKTKKTYDIAEHEKFFFKFSCYLAKDEVLPIFEKKLQELKNELAAL